MENLFARRIIVCHGADKLRSSSGRINRKLRRIREQFEIGAGFT